MIRGPSPVTRRPSPAQAWPVYLAACTLLVQAAHLVELQADYLSLTYRQRGNWLTHLCKCGAMQASSLLESIPRMFSQTQHADACLGAAVQASIDTLKVCPAPYMHHVPLPAHCCCLMSCIAHLVCTPSQNAAASALPTSPSFPPLSPPKLLAFGKLVYMSGAESCSCLS